MMQPIHELLKRIVWDTAFGNAQFELVIFDRIENKMIRIPFSEIQFTPGDNYQLQYVDEDARSHSVPFHRIKAVYRNGERIWHREH